MSEQDHDLQVTDGSATAFQDRLIVGVKNGLAITNGAGPTTVAVTFAEGLPATYAVFVSSNTAFTAMNVTLKVSTGFSVTFTGAASSSTFDVLVIG